MDLWSGLGLGQPGWLSGLGLDTAGLDNMTMAYLIIAVQGTQFLQ